MGADATAERSGVLLVEDNYLVACSLQGLLERLGYAVIGPASSVEEGRQLASGTDLVAAVLDVNILGGTSGALAVDLQSRRCPVVFVTGYSKPELPDAMRDAPTLDKPVDLESLQEAIALARARIDREPAASE